jgi:hypothetical protein
MRKVLCTIALAIPVAVLTRAPADSVSPRAKPLHDRAIVVDVVESSATAERIHPARDGHARPSLAIPRPVV